MINQENYAMFYDNLSEDISLIKQIDDSPQSEVQDDLSQKVGFFAKNITTKQFKENAQSYISGISNLVKRLESWKSSLSENSSKQIFSKTFFVGGLNVAKAGHSDPLHIIYCGGYFYLIFLDETESILPNKEAREKYGYFKCVFLPPYTIQFISGGTRKYADKTIEDLKNDITYSKWILYIASINQDEAAKKSGYVAYFPAFPPGSISSISDYFKIVNHCTYWSKSKKATNIILQKLKIGIEKGQIISHTGISTKHLTNHELFNLIINGNKDQYFFSNFSTRH